MTGRTRFKGILFIGASIVLSAIAQLFMKAGVLELHGEWLGWVSSLVWVLAGLFSYGVSMIFWLAALARYELSVAYPMLSLSYVLVYIGAVIWPKLGESVSSMKTFGILLIMLGLVLVTRSAGDGKNRLNSISGNDRQKH